MKQLLTICFFIATTFTVKAQDGKPTKEETIDFIKGYFSDLKIDSRDGKEYYLYTDNYQVEVSGTTMTVSWNNYNFHNEFDGKSIYEFDLKDINLLSGARNKTAHDCETGIYFNTTNKKLSIKETDRDKETMISGFSVSIYRGADCIDSISDTKIYQAFNHLRKLCGAPEPISF